MKAAESPIDDPTQHSSSENRTRHSVGAAWVWIANERTPHLLGRLGPGVAHPKDL